MGTGQPKQLIFTNRHGRLIVDIKIPGVDFNADNDKKIPGVDPDPVVDDTELPGVDTVVNAPHKIEINDLDVPANNPDPIQIEYVKEMVKPPAPKPAGPTGPR